MQSLTDLFKDTARKLLADGDASARSLKDAVNLVAQELSAALPPTFVLYNSTYGGFGFCSEFVEFAEQEDETAYWQGIPRADPRLRPLILAFGRKVLQELPDMEWMFRAYEALTADDLAALELAQLRLELDRPALEAAVVHLRELLASGAPPTVAAANVYYADKLVVKTVVYTRNNQKFYADYCNEGARRKALHLLEEELLPEAPPPGERHARAAAFTAEYKEHDRYDNDGGYTFLRPRRKDYRSFLEAVREDGRPSWHLQCDYDEREMAYVAWLQQRGIAPDGMDVPLSENEVLRAGLLFASDRNARLDFAQVYALSDWRISEYDGKESVSCRSDGYLPTYLRG